MESKLRSYLKDIIDGIDEVNFAISIINSPLCVVEQTQKERIVRLLMGYLRSKSLICCVAFREDKFMFPDLEK